MKNTDGYDKNCKIIENVMRMVNMKIGEKGSISCTKRLSYFVEGGLEKKRKKKHDEKQTVLEKVPMIKLTGEQNVPYFVVLVVWHNNGSKKMVPLTTRGKSVLDLHTKRS